MRKHSLIVMVLIAVGLWPASAQPQPKITVSLKLGNIQPPDLKRGALVTSGTPITAGPDGVIVFSEQWDSGRANYACVAVTMISYGASGQIKSRATPGQCRGTDVALPVPVAGKPAMVTAFKFSEPKSDGYKPPDVVLSDKRWREFETWSGGLEVPGKMGPIVPNLVYLQGDYRDAIVGSPRACVALCQAEQRCQAVTFIEDQKRCWLKDTVPATAAAPGMFSAAKIAK